MMKHYSVLLMVVFGGMVFFASCKNSRYDKKTLESASNELGVNYCVPVVSDTMWYTLDKTAPIFTGLSGIDFKISTKSKNAEEYFNQGMMLAYGFNHAEAARSFYEAARQDSTCAMCWWGYAYVLGPNYNFGMEPGNMKRAFDAVKKAENLATNGCTQREKDLIFALTKRYSNDEKITRSSLDSSYSASMRDVFNKYPDDVDIAALFAESLMDIHPWDLFMKDGKMQPWTQEILDVLENGLVKAPDHVGLNHFYIHAVEMSQNAEKALSSADKLGDLVPGSSHLVHMPSHIYIRIGKYHEGVLSNLRAVQVDSLYTETCHANGVYPLMLYPHNYHFLSACATLAGERKYALLGAEKTKMHAFEQLLFDPEWSTFQHFYSIPLFVRVKFGLWESIHDVPEPEKMLIYPRIIWHYAQGMAILASGSPKNAKFHLKQIDKLMHDPKLKTLTVFGINSLYDVCRIAALTLAGEISAKKGNYAEALKLLNEAVSFEDKLKYQEPPDWVFSVRHNLGAVMIEAEKYSEAVDIYEQDLKIYPDNGWAIKGLMNSYEGLGDKQKYEDCKKRFEKVWQNSDVEITSSRLL